MNNIKIIIIINLFIFLLFLIENVFGGNCFGSCFEFLSNRDLLQTNSQGQNIQQLNPPLAQTINQNIEPSDIASTSRTTIINEYYEDPLHNENDYNQVLSEKINVSHNQAKMFSHMIVSIYDSLLTNNIQIDLNNLNECAKTLINLREHFIYALDANINSRMPRTSFKLYSFCDELIQTDINNKSLMTLIKISEEYDIANFYCRAAIFLSATNYFLKEINQNNDIFKAIIGKVENIKFEKIEYSQKLNNSLNHLTPIINEMRTILLEDEQLKFNDLNLRSLIENEMTIEKFYEKISELIKIKISLKLNEVEYFIEILFNYFNKLTEHSEELKFKNLMNVNNLENLYKIIDNTNNQIGIYLTKILKNKIEIDCNKLIINENNNEEINKNNKQLIQVLQFCQFGMFLSLGNFLNKSLLNFENKMIIEDEQLLNNSIQIGFNPSGIKEKIIEKKGKIEKIEEKILKYNNEFIPFWNKTKNILIGNEIIDEKNFEDYFNLQSELKIQIEQLSIKKFNNIFKSTYAIYK
ncbi:hypothetical protein Mgra_00004726 [Meloidogyne graminicola]|uniref:Uncharacterized protein n=1 Tax=Meloidogyne graminicola TaxID=189291 RepID=A0A8S9ZRF2_9BILA|nr:hypothetical protein Mgra_00004726 [Meloidogyne graminicola]